MLRILAICSMLFAGTVILFSRAANYGFSNYDDPRYVTNNAHVQAGLTWESVTWAFTANEDYWHPFTWLSHMLDWQLYGPDAYGHHLTSILWHALNGVIVFLLLRRLSGREWLSAFAAALFTWHPLRVESVAWITERKDVMSGFFFLVTVAAYARFAGRREAGGQPWGYYFLALALFLGGLMSKPMLVTLPAVLLIIDFWPLNRLPLDRFAWRRWGTLVLEKAPFFALSALTSIMTVKMQQSTGAFVLDLPLDARLGNALVSIVRYVGKFLWPMNLAVSYPHPGYWPWIALLGSAILVLTITVLGWRQRAKRPWILAGWVAFVVILLPAIGIIQVGFQAMADRYSYIALLGVQVALLWNISAKVQTALPRWTWAVAGGAALLFCVGRTWQQQATWRDPVAMFQHAIAVEERNEYAHALLAYTLYSFQRNNEAESHCLRALELNPRNETALSTLGNIREHQKRFEEAIAAYRTLLEVKPNDWESSYRLGLLLLRSGRTDEGADFMAKAIHASVGAMGNDPTVLYEGGLALSKLGRTKEAREYFEAAVAARADYAEAHTELGLILLNTDHNEAAATHFRAALQTAPHFVVAYIGLGRTAEKLGRTDEATASFEQALQLAPNDAVPHRAWADTLARRKQFPEAARYYERAAELDPKSAETRAALGFILILSGRREEGIARWQEALALDPNFPGLRERLQRMQ